MLIRISLNNIVCLYFSICAAKTLAKVFKSFCPQKAIQAVLLRLQKKTCSLSITGLCASTATLKLLNAVR
jgi:hypothetical protein